MVHVLVVRRVGVSHVALDHLREIIRGVDALLGNVEDQTSVATIKAHHHSSSVLILDVGELLHVAVYSSLALSSATEATQKGDHQGPHTEVPKREQEEHEDAALVMSPPPLPVMSPPPPPPLPRVSLDQCETLVVDDHSHNEGTALPELFQSVHKLESPS